MFKSILSQSLDSEDLDKLAAEFDGMKVIDRNVAKSTGMVGVIVGKMDKNKRITRTLYVRREKDGWKVQDFSGKKELTQARGAVGKRR